MSMPTVSAPRSRFQTSARPLPQPRSTTRSPAAGRRNRRSMSLRIFEPSSGGDTRSWRASVCSASSRYLVCSANSSARPQVEVLARGRAVRASAVDTQAVERVDSASEGAAALGAADERSRRSEIIGSKRRTSVKSASSRSARRSQLYSATAVRARPARARARAPRRRRSRQMPAASASASPGRDEHAR